MFKVGRRFVQMVSCCFVWMTICGGVWSADFDAAWFSGRQNVRVLYYPYEGGRYSFSCFLDDSDKEKHEHADAFPSFVRCRGVVMRNALKKNFKSQEALRCCQGVVSVGKDCARQDSVGDFWFLRLTPDIFKAVVSGAEVVKWSFVTPEMFYSKAPKVVGGAKVLFFMVKGAGVLRGDVMDQPQDGGLCCWKKTKV